jgi:hypothetical protein
MAGLSLPGRRPNDRYDSFGPGVVPLFSVTNGFSRTGVLANLQNRPAISFSLQCPVKWIGLAQKFCLAKMGGLGKDRFTDHLYGSDSR